MSPTPRTEATALDTVSACTLDTPVGPLSTLTRGDVVLAAGFCSPDELWGRLAPEQQGPLETVADAGLVTKRLQAYLDGDLSALDEIEVAQPGTVLQHQVWDGLRAIPAGTTRTYTELAAATDKPKAVRAAGTACGRNLIAPIVPCHRALRSDGSLGGYYYGLQVKRWLLDHEARNA